MLSKVLYRFSVDKKNQLDVTFVLSFISLLQVAQHVSGNHVPIFRSWRLRNVIATCWCCAVTMSGVIQICLSVSGLCVVMWGVMGGGIIVVCRCGLVCSLIKVHTHGCRKVVKTGWQVVHPWMGSYHN